MPRNPQRFVFVFNGFTLLCGCAPYPFLDFRGRWGKKPKNLRTMFSSRMANKPGHRRTTPHKRATRSLGLECQKPLRQPRRMNAPRGRWRRAPLEQYLWQSQQPAVRAPGSSRMTTRAVATCTMQVGSQPPRAYASARLWGPQLQVAADAPADRVPYPFRAYTLTKMKSANPGVNTQPDAVYCEGCGGLVVMEQRHIHSINQSTQGVPGVRAVLARVH